MGIQDHVKERVWIVYLAAICALTVAGYFVISPQTLYEPGDDIGYSLGLAGGVMMLFLLLYPLRKRVRVFSTLGSLPAWFKWHMIFGILGPALIVLHSTFHIKSANAAVAMVSMLLVAGSGVFGRFFYTKIHHGLYGRQATVSELKAKLEQDDVKAVFSIAPNLEKVLEEFRIQADVYAQSSGLALGSFINVSIQARRLTRSQAAELRRIMVAQAEAGNFDPAQLRKMEELFGEYRERIAAYLNAVRDAAQFHTYERLFSWWHIFHIPLVYMMVFSAIYHVYAVHAY